MAAFKVHGVCVCVYCVVSCVCARVCTCVCVCVCVVHVKSMMGKGDGMISTMSCERGVKCNVI